MIELRRTCPQGHEWHTTAGAVSDAAAAETCPVCGALADTLVPAGATPGAVSPQSATAAVAFPTVPGYTIEAELGRGGMGVVYRAWQTGLRRAVALKMVIAGPLASPELLAHFRTEAEAVARLAHPNIVQIFEIGEAAGRPYFSMEYVPGGSLAERMHGPREPHEAAKIVATLARAVHYAHEQGIVHRDLKPANVLLTVEGTPKIADFGLAKLTAGESSSQTCTGDVMGSPSYMSPEQARGATTQIGPASDVYALGAVLYELLTGRPPFAGRDAMETLLSVLHDEPVPPHRLAPRVPRNMETIALHCLDKSPRLRV